MQGWENETIKKQTQKIEMVRKSCDCKYTHNQGHFQDSIDKPANSNLFIIKILLD